MWHIVCRIKESMIKYLTRQIQQQIPEIPYIHNQLPSYLTFTDPDRFTWLLVTLACCSFVAGILSFLVPKATQNVDAPKFKSEAKEENEIGVEINHAYEGDFQENTNTRSV